MRYLMTVDAPANHVRTVVKTRRGMDLELQTRMAVLVKRAAHYGDRGILVTRHSPCDFMLELHTGVPYGETMELDLS